MTLYAYTLDTARDVKDRFQAFDRDCYPLEVYQAILDYELELADSSGQSRALDVIAWCCEIQATTIAEYNKYHATCEEEMIANAADLKAAMENIVYVYGVDYENGIVYSS